MMLYTCLVADKNVYLRARVFIIQSIAICMFRYLTCVYELILTFRISLLFLRSRAPSRLLAMLDQASWEKRTRITSPARTTENWPVWRLGPEGLAFILGTPKRLFFCAPDQDHIKNPYLDTPVATCIWRRPLRGAVPGRLRVAIPCSPGLRLKGP